MSARIRGSIRSAAPEHGAGDSEVESRTARGHGRRAQSTVSFFCGQSAPEFTTAALTRSRLSTRLLSGSTRCDGRPPAPGPPAPRRRRRSTYQTTRTRTRESHQDTARTRRGRPRAVPAAGSPITSMRTPPGGAPAVLTAPSAPRGPAGVVALTGVIAAIGCREGTVRPAPPPAGLDLSTPRSRRRPAPRCRSHRACSARQFRASTRHPGDRPAASRPGPRTWFPHRAPCVSRRHHLSGTHADAAQNKKWILVNHSRVVDRVRHPPGVPRPAEARERPASAARKLQVTLVELLDVRRRLERPERAPASRSVRAGTCPEPRHPPWTPRRTPRPGPSALCTS